MIYEKLRDPSRHWGYWLVKREWHYYDEGGRHFSSVRDAFWTGRLGMPAHEWDPRGHHRHGQSLAEVELERIGACLAAVKRSHDLEGQVSTEMFDRDGAYARFYGAWLQSEGLVSEGRLTAEGQAVLHMLALTRPPRLGLIDDGQGVDTAPEVGEPALEAWFRRLSQLIGRQTFRFERMEQEHGGRLGIELVGEAHGEGRPEFSSIGTGRMIWSQTFGDQASRDRFYRWLCIRLDRWGDWGRTAWHRGPAYLNQIFIAFLAEQIPDMVSTEASPQAVRKERRSRVADGAGRQAALEAREAGPGE